MAYTYSPLRDAQDIAAAQSDVVVVPAVPGKRIRVIAAIITADTANTTVLFESGTSTALTGTLDLGVANPLVLPELHCGWFETAVGQALTATTGAGGGVTTHLVYTLD